jgi:hypothetical protein
MMVGDAVQYGDHNRRGTVNRTESLRSWLIVLGLLLATGFITAVWPLLNTSFSLGGGSRPPTTEPPPIVIPVPPFLVEQLGTQIVLNSVESLALIVGLTVLVTVSVVVVGVILTAMIVGLGKAATAVIGSKLYQEHVAKLNKREQEKIKQARETSPKPNEPRPYLYHLDPLSLSLIVLLFVIFMGALIYAVLFPDGTFTLFGNTFSSATPIILLLFLITIPLLAWRARRARLEAVLQKDNAPIPWDFFAVLITGLLVVGVGLGVMLFIN